MKVDVQGLVAPVTGFASGIGGTIALFLPENGVTVAVSQFWDWFESIHACLFGSEYGHGKSIYYSKGAKRLLRSLTSSIPLAKRGETRDLRVPCFVSRRMIIGHVLVLECAWPRDWFRE